MVALHSAAPLVQAPSCRQDAHVGPLLRTELYNAVPGWEGVGDCAACGSTVHRDHVVPSSGPLYEERDR